MSNALRACLPWSERMSIAARQLRHDPYRPNAAGSVKMPAPTIEPTTSATRAPRESRWSGVLLITGYVEQHRPVEPVAAGAGRAKSRGRPAPQERIGLLEEPCLAATVARRSGPRAPQRRARRRTRVCATAPSASSVPPRDHQQCRSQFFRAGSGSRDDGARQRPEGREGEQERRDGKRQGGRLGDRRDSLISFVGRPLGAARGSTSTTYPAVNAARLQHGSHHHCPLRPRRRAAAFWR